MTSGRLLGTSEDLAADFERYDPQARCEPVPDDPDQHDLARKSGSASLEEDYGQRSETRKSRDPQAEGRKAGEDGCADDLQQRDRSGGRPQQEKELRGSADLAGHRLPGGRFRPAVRGLSAMGSPRTEVARRRLGRRLGSAAYIKN
jgi:hypothetical protein